MGSELDATLATHPAEVATARPSFRSIDLTHRPTSASEIRSARQRRSVESGRRAHLAPYGCNDQEARAILPAIVVLRMLDQHDECTLARPAGCFALGGRHVAP